MLEYVEFDKYQFGFQEKSSTNAPTMEFLSNINTELDKGYY